MNERLIELKKQALLDEFRNNGEPHLMWICDRAWNEATKACLALSLEILREVLRDETSELTYGAAGQIQNRLHQELDA